MPRTVPLKPQNTFVCIGCESDIGEARVVHAFRKGIADTDPKTLVESGASTHWAIEVSASTASNCTLTRHPDYDDNGWRFAKIWCGSCGLNLGNLQGANHLGGGCVYHFLKKSNVGFRKSSEPTATLTMLNDTPLDLRRIEDSGLYDYAFAEAFRAWYSDFAAGPTFKRRSFKAHYRMDGISLHPSASSAAAAAAQRAAHKHAAADDDDDDDGAASDASGASAYTIKSDVDDDFAKVEAELERCQLNATLHRFPGFDRGPYQLPPLVDFDDSPPPVTKSPPKTALTSPHAAQRERPARAAKPKMGPPFACSATHAVIHWDYENIAVPKGASVIETAKKIGNAVQEALNVKIKGYFAYVETQRVPAGTLDDLGKAGVDCIDCSARGKRGQADYRIIVRAMTSTPEEAVVIVSGDGDMAHPLSVLSQLGRATAIVYDKNNTQNVSTALLEATECAIPVAISSKRSPAHSIASSAVSSASSSTSIVPATVPAAALAVAGCDDGERALLLAIDRAPEAREGGWKCGPVVGDLYHKIKGLRTNTFKPSKQALLRKNLIVLHDQCDMIRLTAAAATQVANL